MVIIYGGVQVDPDRVAEITALAVDYVAEVNKEAGCVNYTLSWNAAAPNSIVLLEHWADEAAYLAHTQQPHVAEWTKAIAAASLAAPAFTKTLVPAAE